MAHRFSLRIYSVSIDAIRKLAKLIVEIARHDPDLARQLRRSLASIPLDIAEGMESEGKLRCSRDRNALGSCNESIAAFEVAQALGYIKLEADALEALGQVRGTLLKLVMPKR